MFGIFKKSRPAEPSTAEIFAQTNAATKALEGKWIEFNQLLKFNDAVPLSEIMEAFIIPAREYVMSAHPFLIKASNQAIWMMVFIAVADSGTHPDDVVIKATEDIENKYAN